MTNILSLLDLLVRRVGCQVYTLSLLPTNLAPSPSGEHLLGVEPIDLQWHAPGEASRAG